MMQGVEAFMKPLKTATDKKTKYYDFKIKTQFVKAIQKSTTFTKASACRS